MKKQTKAAVGYGEVVGAEVWLTTRTATGRLKKQLAVKWDTASVEYKLNRPQRPIYSWGYIDPVGFESAGPEIFSLEMTRAAR